MAAVDGYLLGDGAGGAEVERGGGGELEEPKHTGPAELELTEEARPLCC